MLQEGAASAGYGMRPEPPAATKVPEPAPGMLLSSENLLWTDLLSQGSLAGDCLILL